MKKQVGKGMNQVDEEKSILEFENQIAIMEIELKNKNQLDDPEEDDIEDDVEDDEQIDDGFDDAADDAIVPSVSVKKKRSSINRPNDLDAASMESLLSDDGAVIKPPPPQELVERKAQSRNNLQDVTGDPTQLCGCFRCRALFPASKLKAEDNLITADEKSVQCPFCKTPTVLLSRNGSRVADGIIWRLWAEYYAGTGAICMGKMSKNRR